MQHPLWSKYNQTNKSLHPINVLYFDLLFNLYSKKNLVYIYSFKLKTKCFFASTMNLDYGIYLVGDTLGDITEMTGAT